MKVPFSYLDRQFQNIDAYLQDIKKFVATGNFTLGKELTKFEEAFAKLCQANHAIGVASGTDALIISMKLLGIKPGDEVITTPMTFIATVGAIVQVGAIPVFVDSEDGYVIDPKKIEEKITSKTKALLPVHYTGNLADMPQIKKIADQYGLILIEDSCQALAGTIEGKPIGSWGEAACFSLHPLKNLNVWSDGGVITTNNTQLAKKIRLFRNHGLISRDEVVLFGTNSRLDTLQAVIGNRLIQEIDFITEKRIQNAQKYDQAFSQLKDWVQIPKRRKGVKHVFHLYIIRVEQRNQLLSFLTQRGIEAKIHYPIPVHLQPAAKYLGYQKGDFPVCESHCDTMITLPCHQHLSTEEVDYVIDSVKEFYASKLSPAFSI